MIEMPIARFEGVGEPLRRHPVSSITFSPDGARTAYVRENDLFAASIEPPWRAMR